MRQIIIGLNLLGSFVIFAMTINLFETTVMFLLFGILPSSVQPVDATHMLIVYVWSGIAVLWYVLHPLVRGIYTAVRKRLPAALQLASRLVRQGQDSLGPQLKLFKQESLVFRLTRR